MAKAWRLLLRAACLFFATMPWASNRALAQAPEAGSGTLPSTIVTAVLLRPLDPSMPLAEVQLRRVSSTGASRRLTPPFTSYGDSLDLSKDGRRLVYTDQKFRLHLITLSSGRDQVLGKGIWAQFSADGRYLAYLTGGVMPIITPGAQGHLMVYDLTTGQRSLVGSKNPLLSDFAWSPRSDRLAWQIHLLKGGKTQKRPNPRGPLWMAVASAPRPRQAQVMRPPGRLGDAMVSGQGVEVRSDGSPTWSAAGRSILYWRFLSKEPSTDTYRWQLVRWRLSNGPARVVWTTRAAFTNEMLPPPAVVSPNGSVIASLLGGPNHDLNRLTLYLPAQGRARPVRLPGEPRQVVFSPSSRQLVAVWDQPSANDKTLTVRRASLVDVGTGKVRDLGPALQAFWCTCG